MEKKKRIFIGIITIIAIILVIILINIVVSNILGEENVINTSQVENTRIEENIIANSNTTNEDDTNNPNASTVYFTSDISSQGLLNIYHALGFEPEGNVAVKLSTGEMGGDYYLHPELIGDLVQEVNGTIVENNTAYGGSRSSTAAHMQTAEAHGFTRNCRY